LSRPTPSRGRRRAGWSTSAPSAALKARPSPSTEAATRSALAIRPPVTFTRPSGTPRRRGRELTSLRIFGVLAVAALRAGAGGASPGLAPAAGPAVTAIDLGTLGGSFSEARAMNASGQVGGESAAPPFGTNAFSWTQAGGMVDLGTLGGSASFAGDVNASGQVVGESNLTPGGAIHAFSWTKAGGMIDLGTLGGTFSTAYGVNARGEVVGESTTAAGGPSHPFLRPKAGGIGNLATPGQSSR